jgi:hypothetical protein
MRFLKKKRDNSSDDLLLLPGLDGVSEENKSHGLLGPIIEQYQYIDMSQKFVDRLTVLLGRIDLRIMKEKKNSHDRHIGALRRRAASCRRFAPLMWTSQSSIS